MKQTQILIKDKDEDSVLVAITIDNKWGVFRGHRFLLDKVKNFDTKNEAIDYAQEIAKEDKFYPIDDELYFWKENKEK